MKSRSRSPSARLELTAHILVQQMTYHTVSAKIMLLCRLSGMGTSYTSRWDCHRHSGNHELVCVRHRASKTIYVSEVIEPHACVDPAYGELQVGIYIAAIQDAIDRKQ